MHTINIGWPTTRLGLIQSLKGDSFSTLQQLYDSNPLSHELTMDSPSQVSVLASANFAVILPLIALYCPCQRSMVCQRSVCQCVFKYLRDCSLVFSEILHEVGGQESKESDTAEILKKKS